MFGEENPKLTPVEVETISKFISNYPYSTLTYLCRMLSLKPAEAAAKVMTFDLCNEWWDKDAFAAALNRDCDRLIAQEWEPGVSPITPLTKGQAFQLFEHTARVEIDVTWDVYDMMHRMSLEPEALRAYLVDYCISSLLSRMKHIGGGQSWVFAPETIENAAINNSWINGWPNRNEITPYCHYCLSCGTFFTDTEATCDACGASRCLVPQRPVPIPGEIEERNHAVSFDEIANL